MENKVIDNQEPVRKEGFWIPDGNHGYECSKCWRTNKEATLYCPACGSRNRISDGYVK